MNLLSKELPLEESIKNMRAVLADVGCETTFTKEKHPLGNCYSVNLASVEAPKHIYSNGKGIISDASTASAYGEYIERLQTNNFFIDFYLGEQKYYPDEVAFEFGGEYLSDELIDIYDPNGELSEEDLVDFNSDYKDKIVSLPFVKSSTSEIVYFPINILSNLYVSNGLASGNTPQEAKIQALSEIFERYAKIEIIKNGYSLPRFPDEVVKSFKRVYEDKLSLEKEGYIVEVLDASLGGKYPVTTISLINPKNSTLFVSFGAHPILEVSLERTMTELMQGRSLENLDTFETPTFDMSIVEDSFNLESHFVDSNGKMGFGFLSTKHSFEYVPWKYDGDSSDEEYSFLTDILQKMDREIYLREYDYLGFYSCQMIVPSMSEVYPIEDLVYNNKNTAKQIRDMVLNFENYDYDVILDAIESLDDTLDMGKYIGVIFENSFTMAEFKAQIHLLLGNLEDAHGYLEYGANTLGHVIAELIQLDELDLDFDEFKEGLFNIFTQKRVLKALAILESKEFFVDRSLSREYYNILFMYHRLEKKKQKML